MPDDIPEEFIVNVSELMIGQSVRASEIPLGANITLKSPGDAVISHVVSLKAEEAAPAAEAAATGTEPEVIKKGKKDEAGAEGAAPAAPAKKK